MQPLANATSEFCAARFMTIKAAKSVCMPFGADAGRFGYNIQVNGDMVRQAGPQGGVCLCLLFDSSASAYVMVSRRSACFVSAFHGIVSALRASSCVPSMLPPFLRLLHAVAEPSGLYGSELWGVFLICTNRGLPGFYSLSDVLEHKRCSILRGYLHLPQSVPYVCMLHELGCVPLVHAYVLRAVRFYNSLVLDGQGGVYRGVLQQNIADARRGRSPVQNWFFHLCAVLRLIMPTGRWLSDVRNLQQLNIKQVKRALVDAYDKYTASFRTVHEGEGSKIGFYFREMAGHSLGKQPDYMSLCLPRRSVLTFLRFRLGCHYLRVNTGRWTGLQRDERTCLRLLVGTCG
eukprot:jgi/Chrzof1/14368/Cz09g00080.t1